MAKFLLQQNTNYCSGYPKKYLDWPFSTFSVPICTAIKILRRIIFYALKPLQSLFFNCMKFKVQSNTKQNYFEFEFEELFWTMMVCNLIGVLLRFHLN